MNNEDAILQRILNLAASTFDRDVNTLRADDDFFEALSIDSMQAMDMLTDLETEFGVEVPDYELADVRTFRELVVVVQRRL
jgi:acyl carrier protein